MKNTSKLAFLFSGLSLISFLLTRWLVGAWIPFLWIPLGFFVILFGLAVLQERQSILHFLTMKTTKHGMNMGALIGLVLVVLIVVNFLSVRHYVVWDFSGNKVNTLSDQSLKILNSLDSELSVRFFYKKGVEGNEENRKAFRELIKKYQDKSPYIKLEFVEVNEHPDLAEAYGVTKGSGVVFLEYKGHKSRIEKIEEQEVSNALVKVTRDKDKTVYFVVGHGENDLEEAKEATGLNAVKLMLENNRYVVKTIALNLNAKIPDDADVVVVVGPTQAYIDYELQALEAYLQRGGGLFIALKSKHTEGLERLLAKLGVEPMNNYILNVVDTAMGKGLQQGQTLGTVFSNSSDITKVFGKDEAVVFRNPMSFKKTKLPEGVSFDDLVKTPETSMAFNTLDIKNEGPAGAYTLVYDEKGKFPGAKDQDFHMVVAGDTDFLGNQLLYQGLNRDLLLNTMASLAKEQNLISIAPREPNVTQLSYTDTKFYLFLIFFVIPLPILLLSSSVVLWIRRRHA